jgi:hypothetical protein
MGCLNGTVLKEVKVYRRHEAKASRVLIQMLKKQRRLQEHQKALKNENMYYERNMANYDGEYGGFSEQENEEDRDDEENEEEQS